MAPKEEEAHMPRYSNDPRKIRARFGSKCPKCGKQIRKGDEIFYYPSERRAYCMSDDCGAQMERDFNAACFDDAMMGGY